MDIFQSIFVSFKGWFEGIHKGFYRSQHHKSTDDGCLDDNSFEALEYIAKGLNWRDDWAAGVLGLQALFHLIVDNNVSCRFDAIAADSLTFCYIY